MSIDGRDDDLDAAATDGADPRGSARRSSEAKRRSLESALERGKTQIRIDARLPAVKVPPAFTTEPALALNLSWRFADTRMVVNERGVAATLRFNQVPFRCAIPWSALWGILAAGDDAVQVWPLDLPPELGGPDRPRDPNTPSVELEPPRLVALDGGRPPASPSAESAPTLLESVRPDRAHKPRRSRGEDESLLPDHAAEVPGAAPDDAPATDASPTDPRADTSAGQPPDAPKRGHLRLVK